MSNYSCGLPTPPQRLVHALEHPLLHHAAEVLVGKEAVEHLLVLVAALQHLLPEVVVEAEFKVFEDILLGLLAQEGVGYQVLLYLVEQEAVGGVELGAEALIQDVDRPAPLS